MKARSEKGAAVVEFALILPLLITIFAGTIEFSLLYFNKQILATATREGARLGIARATESEIRERVRKICREEYNEGLPLGLGNFLPMLATFGTEIVNLPDENITVTGADGAFQQDLTVAVQYEYRFLMPAILGLGTTKTLGVSTVMKMEADSP
jgi:hypothetical protein